MIAFIVGLLFGCLNFYLLVKMIDAILQSKAQQALLFMLAKLVMIALSLGLCIWLMRDDIIWNAIGLAIPLLLGAFIYVPIRNSREKSKKRKGHGAKND